jgi:hypothetical protein
MIWGPQSDDYEDYCVLGSDTMQFGRHKSKYFTLKMEGADCSKTILVPFINIWHISFFQLGYF